MEKVEDRTHPHVSLSFLLPSLFVSTVLPAHGDKNRHSRKHQQPTML